jgi:hypothetical protein
MHRPPVSPLPWQGDSLAVVVNYTVTSPIGDETAILPFQFSIVLAVVSTVPWKYIKAPDYSIE